jgi:hypothetical protein
VSVADEKFRRSNEHPASDRCPACLTILWGRNDCTHCKRHWTHAQLRREEPTIHHPWHYPCDCPESGRRGHCCPTNGRQFNEAEHKPQPRHRDILDEARDLVHGDRQRDYDHPSRNLTRIGTMWGVMLDREPIPPRTVALMMICLKLAREVKTSKPDNLTDICGYSLCADLCDEA